jgi:hypothetical protein
VELGRVLAEVEERALVALAAGLEEEEEAAAERCIEEEHSAGVVVVGSSLAVAVLCIPALEGLSSPVEGCVEAVRNVHGQDPRNAKHCEDHYNFCCDCFLLLCLAFLVLHRSPRVVGCEDPGACFHLESFQRPMLPHRQQQRAEARQHSRWQRCLTSIVSGPVRLLPISSSKRRRTQSQQ